ncbi:Alpha/beta hydrolase fold domain-containing protein [Sulfidibacter corallicola]|uniref:Alpha/beta hydrolase fold domain-containing protein n=1 Tax=Sulfidibacter corallicola TaxID=2818388 RepID=A0A8A4TCY0_SULCO|nr:alpha/beta hydrolase fold domain-containing protein [Sulfidibacter corallicola]QTD47796.1 alpha/beta hydrolase fold domain-containing protein [Sulfidibacter corallicola]
MSQPRLETIEIEPKQPAEACVIWLHGLGADGHDFEPIVPELGFDDLPVRFIFPHAPVRPVTLNGGFAMRAWYDIYSLERGTKEDGEGVRESERLVRDLISREKERGIAANRLVLAGFSQGGAMALHTMIRFEEQLAGVLALSCYVPINETAADEDRKVNHGIPLFMAHGTYDPVVPIQWGRKSHDLLETLGYQPKWHQYPMPHSVSPEEIRDIGLWLRGVLG